MIFGRSQVRFGHLPFYDLLYLALNGLECGVHIFGIGGHINSQKTRINIRRNKGVHGICQATVFPDLLKQAGTHVAP